ncbi:MAG TPA: AAA family ATPase [Candidatus Saccharimonadales bacterium]|nr:AAA family ATPase [Candidatus Saccharimonadales bacterium]
MSWRCDPARYDLSVSEKEARLIGIIGQDRAIRAMKMGIELYSPGYNVFVCGITGTGRTTTVKRIFDNIKSSCPLPMDRCFVHNFSQPERPRLLVLPRGAGPAFRREMERFRREIAASIPRLLESGRHLRRREKIVTRYEGQGDALLDTFDRKVEKQGFTLKRVREGGILRPELFPEIAGKAVPVGDLERMVKERKLTRTRATRVARQHAALRLELDVVARESRQLLEKMDSEIGALEREDVAAALKESAHRITTTWDSDAIRVYLEDAVRWLSEHTDLLRPAGSDGDKGPADETAAIAGRLAEFLDVNVVLDNTGREQCPVVIESLPTFRRLFGYFEKAMDPSGHWKTDYRKIRAGSLLMADGGYLVLNADEVLRSQGVWRAMKRTLVNRALEIYEEGSPLQVPATTMTPDPVPLNVKVILIGDSSTYYHLYSRDKEFRKIFKVLADFDHEMDLNRKSLRQYAAFVSRMCRDEGLAPFEPGAVATVAEYGARKAGRQDKLTARFGEISDLLREADYWRRKKGDPKVTADHVKAAVRAALQRNNLVEEKLREMIGKGLILVHVSGSRVGQINGLVVHDLGPHAFGVPARITATASPGSAGIINIEREARLSGSSHDKGVLIIGGYFRERFGLDRPVTFTASIAFEQSYGGIDGDSASATEIFAVLSALSGKAIDQGIAVTGSVDQKGMIQPVGGINLKIEGFFHICKRRGLTGRQGVIIPETNVRDLMLNEEVVEAVRRGRFHLYPVRTVEEGIEILTGVPAGARNAKGEYPDGSLYDAVNRRLARIARQVQRTIPTTGANTK